MTREKFIQNIVILEAFYDNFKIMDSEAKLKLWYQMFSGVDEKLFTEAVIEHINTERYKPTVASLKEIMVRLGDNSTSPEIAWQEVRKDIGRYGAMATDKYLQDKDMNNPKYQAIQKMGWNTIAKSNERELPYLYNSFKAYYTKEKDSKVMTDLNKGQLGLMEVGKEQLENKNIKELGIGQ